MNNQNFFTSVRPVRYREILSALITRDATTASVPIRFRVRRSGRLTTAPTLTGPGPPNQ